MSKNNNDVPLPDILTRYIVCLYPELVRLIYQFLQSSYESNCERIDKQKRLKLIHHAKCRDDQYTTGQIDNVNNRQCE